MVSDGLREGTDAPDASTGDTESNDGLEISREIFFVEAPLLVLGLGAGALLPRPKMLKVIKGGMGATAASNGDIVS